MNTGFGLMDVPHPMEGYWLGEAIASDRAIASWQNAYNELVNQYNNLLDAAQSLKRSRDEWEQYAGQWEKHAGHLKDALTSNKTTIGNLESTLSLTQGKVTSLEKAYNELVPRFNVIQRAAEDVARLAAFDVGLRALVDLQLEALSALDAQHALLNEETRDRIYYGKHKEAISAYLKKSDRRWIYDYANSISLMAVMGALDDAIRALQPDNQILDGMAKQEVQLKIFNEEVEKLSFGEQAPEIDRPGCAQTFVNYVRGEPVVDPMLPKPEPDSVPKV